MVKVNKTNEVIEGYTELWSWWLNAASAQAQAYATAMADPTYDAAKLLEAVRGAAKLANEAVVRGAVEVLDMVSIYSSNMDEPTIERSNDLVTNVTAGERTVVQHGTWTSITTGAPMNPKYTVTFYPSLLLDGDGAFYFTVDASDLINSDLFKGQAAVLDAAGNVVDVIDVQIGL